MDDSLTTIITFLKVLEADPPLVSPADLKNLPELSETLTSLKPTELETVAEKIQIWCGKNKQFIKASQQLRQKLKETPESPNTQINPRETNFLIDQPLPANATPSDVSIQKDEKGTTTITDGKTKKTTTLLEHIIEVIAKSLQHE